MGRTKPIRKPLYKKKNKTYDHNHHFIHLQIATSSIENHLSELAGLIYDLQKSQVLLMPFLIKTINNFL